MDKIVKQNSDTFKPFIANNTSGLEIPNFQYNCNNGNV